MGANKQLLMHGVVKELPHLKPIGYNRTAEFNWILISLASKPHISKLYSDSPSRFYNSTDKVLIFV